MKIISHFKDYYDYLQGINGVDDKIVYERICQKEDIDGHFTKAGVYSPSLNTWSWSAESFSICICGKIYKVVWIKDQFYHFREDISPEIMDKLSGRWDMAAVNPLPFRYPPVAGSGKGKKDWFERRPKQKDPLLELNDKYNCPVLLAKWNGSRYLVIKNIKLADFGFASVIPAQDIWNQIYNFLSRAPEIIDNRNDTQRLEAAGFDKKTSFRNV